MPGSITFRPTPGRLPGIPSQVQDLIKNDIITSLTGKYGGYEIPKKFIFMSENFTVENGTLTQTLKLKRRVVLSKYKDAIERLYT